MQGERRPLHRHLTLRWGVGQPTERPRSVVWQAARVSVSKVAAIRRDMVCSRRVVWKVGIGVTV